MTDLQSNQLEALINEHGPFMDGTILVGICETDQMPVIIEPDITVTVADPLLRDIIHAQGGNAQITTTAPVVIDRKTNGRYIARWCMADGAVVELPFSLPIQ